RSQIDLLVQASAQMQAAEPLIPVEKLKDPTYEPDSDQVEVLENIEVPPVSEFKLPRTPRPKKLPLQRQQRKQSLRKMSLRPLLVTYSHSTIGLISGLWKR